MENNEVIGVIDIRRDRLFILFLLFIYLFIYNKSDVILFRLLREANRERKREEGVTGK